LKRYIGAAFSLIIEGKKEIPNATLVVVPGIGTNFFEGQNYIVLDYNVKGHNWTGTKLYSISYSLRPILLFANTDVSTTKICLDTSTLAKSIMGRREYIRLQR
jgi:hypothetical protein